MTMLWVLPPIKDLVLVDIQMMILMILCGILFCLILPMTAMREYMMEAVGLIVRELMPLILAVSLINYTGHGSISSWGNGASSKHFPGELTGK